MLINIIKENWQKILLSALFLSAIALFISLIPDREYRSEAKILIVQKHDSSLDSYTAIRSSERIAELLSQVIYTDSFMRQILMIIPNDLTSKLFSADDREARKSWQKKIAIRVQPNSNMLDVSVYDKSRQQAREIVSAISYILINRGANYHGGENVVIKEVDSPLDSRYPARPNILLNLSLAFVVGLFSSIGFFYYQKIKGLEKTLVDYSPAPAPSFSYEPNLATVAAEPEASAIETQAQDIVNNQDTVNNDLVNNIEDIDNINPNISQEFIHSENY